jgi:adenine-specific DNA-methyltransferase
VIDLSYAQKTGAAPMPAGEILRLVILHSQAGSEQSRFPYQFSGRSFTPPGARGWSTNVDGFRKVETAQRMFTFGKNLNYKRYHRDFPYREINNLWNDIRSGGFQDEKVYVVQTQAPVLERCILMATDPGDLVLDPTCGSGTTAFVAEQWGRRWITIDTSRVALALARTRLMAGRYPYYLLADSPDGIAKEGELTGQAIPERPTENDIKPVLSARPGPRGLTTVARCMAWRIKRLRFGGAILRERLY